MKPYLIMNELENIFMKLDQLLFLDSVSFLPYTLRKLPDTFGLEATKSWYPTILIPRKNTLLMPHPQHIVLRPRRDERKED